MKPLESQVLERLKKVKKPTKQRYTFFLDKQLKQGLAEWCKENGFSESRAIEEMIQATVPNRLLKRI